MVESSDEGLPAEPEPAATTAPQAASATASETRWRRRNIQGIEQWTPGSEGHEAGAAPPTVAVAIAVGGQVGAPPAAGAAQAGAPACAPAATGRAVAAVAGHHDLGPVGLPPGAEPPPSRGSRNPASRRGETWLLPTTALVPFQLALNEKKRLSGFHDFANTSIT